MKSTSIQSLKAEINSTLQQCRKLTLGLVDYLSQDTFQYQAHADFSPVGWHLGHIAYTEAYWILERCAKMSPQYPQYHRLFAADGLPKSQRQKLPSITETTDYLSSIRTAVMDYLTAAPIDKQERLWRWLIQHECQHSETICIVLQLHQRKANWLQYNLSNYQPSKFGNTRLQPETIRIPAGEFEMGWGGIAAQDNERPPHKVYLDTYWIDRYPVTCREYGQFMAAGGYQQRHWWSDAGWKWLEAYPVKQPLYWVDSDEWANHPVCGVSWYEAEAYANFVGKQLPTEAQWEKAASFVPAGKQRLYPWGNNQPNSYLANLDNQVEHTTPVNAYPTGRSALGCNDMLGNVWEWTADWFDGYQGFVSYPYRGYSQAYFDRQHKVLKGGSWATRPWTIRNSFRNWYNPWVRQIFAGFRTVSSD